MMKLLCGSTLLAASLTAQAAVQWQDVSVSYLNGSNYRVDGPKKQVLTFEHVAGTSWGDSFFFLDHLRSDNGARSNYAEWSPRLSLGKLSGTPMTFGVVNDVLFTSTVEMSSLRTDFLYGIATDLTLPGFKYFKLNFYRRNNDGLADNWQITTSWALPFTLAGQHFLYDGFLDWYNTTEDQRASMNLTSQLKWAMHEQFNWQSKVYLGVEYVFWRNKYGIPDSPAFRTNESNLNLLLKVHF